MTEGLTSINPLKLDNNIAHGHDSSNLQNEIYHAENSTSKLKETVTQKKQSLQNAESQTKHQDKPIVNNKEVLNAGKEEVSDEGSEEEVPLKLNRKTNENE